MPEIAIEEQRELCARFRGWEKTTLENSTIGQWWKRSVWKGR